MFLRYYPICFEKICIHLLQIQCQINYACFSFYFRYNLLGSKNLTQKFNSDLAEYSGHIFATCLGDPSWVKTCKRAITRYSYDSNSAKLTIGHPGHFRKVWDFWRNRGLQQVLSTGNASVLMNSLFFTWFSCLASNCKATFVSLSFSFQLVRLQSKFKKLTVN